MQRDIEEAILSQRTRSSAYRQQQRRNQADAQNTKLEATFAQLQNILTDALSRDTYIDLERLKTTPRIESFKKEKPLRGNFLPAPPAGLNKMLPWKKREYEQLYSEGEKRYERAEREYQKAKTDHEIRMNVRRNKAIEQNQKVERIQERFSAGESKAVEDYFIRVLDNGSYPESFPNKSQLVYTANSRHLSVEHDLPTFEAVPEAKAYRYVEARDDIMRTAPPQSQRKLLYLSVLAQIALRTIHEIYRADRTDRTEKINSLVFSGFVNAEHPGTGKPGRFCLISVSTTRRQFVGLNLKLVDPLGCLKHLLGRISLKPEDLVEIDPFEVIGDTKTPPSLSQPLGGSDNGERDRTENQGRSATAVSDLTKEGRTADEQPRRADEVYQRVSVPVPEAAPKDIPIPARTQTNSISAPYSQNGIQFVEQARAYVDRTETQAEPVPFQQYWYTYEAMDTAQQQWYFYWRAQLRQGNRLPTDLSYLFVHIYEVINLVGFESPDEALSHLDEFWRYYRQLQPDLDRYLPDWIADFIIVHELAPNALGWYGEVIKIADVKDFNLAIEAWVQAGDSYEAFPAAIFFELANFNPTESPFYRRFSKSNDLDLWYPRAMDAVDEGTRMNREMSLFEYYQPKYRTIVKREPFACAFHAYPKTKIEVAATHNWMNAQSLRRWVHNCLKHADNILREQAGYRYRLKVTMLSDACKSVIEKALQPEAARRELSIDHAEIAQLAKDSHAIRDRLLADTEPVEESAAEQFMGVASWAPETPRSKASLDRSRSQAVGKRCGNRPIQG